MTNSSLSRAILLHQQGRLAEAVPLYQEVLAREPNNTEALHMAGLALAALGQLPMAVKLLAAAAALQPTDPAIMTNFASALSQAGRQAEAVKYYDVALALRSDLLEAHRGRGVSLMLLGQLDAAIDTLQRAAALAPNDESTHNTLGVAFERANRPEEAADAFRRAVSINPDNPQAHHNLGLVQAAQGLHAEALASFDRALQKAPTTVATLLLRGKALANLARPSEALVSFDRALQLAPNEFDVHFQRGRVLTILDRLPEAVASFDQAIAINRSSAEAVNNRGAVLVRMFRPAEALPDFERAVALNPNYADAYINAGNALKGLARFPEALDKFERALSIRPADLTATWSKAVLKLTVGDFREGWPLYESRLQLEPARSSQPQFEQPRWTGTETLVGKTLLVHAEQGLGDTLQFARYIQPVEALGAHVIFEIQPVLARLMSSLAMKGKLLVRGDPLPEFDYHIPLLSLPLALQTDLATIPRNVPYLAVAPRAIELWRTRLSQLPGFKVGIHWHGATEAEKFSALQARSFPLASMAPLTRVAGVSLVSLQKGAGAQERKHVGFSGSIAELTDPTYMGPDELANETAAIIKGLDLVITGDTALAHLAGALGVPVWLALQAVPDWRWLMDRIDSPWYPTMRLFRQRAAGDWPELFERMATALAAHLAQRP